jgi:hypothetical protein
MVIGQIVAISFATNLFLIALLLSPPAPPAPSTGASNRKRWLGPWLINFAAVIATEFPAYLLADDAYWHHKNFLPVLLIPHLALLVLPSIRAIVPAQYFRDDDVEFTEGLYKYLWGATFFGGGLLWWKVTGLAYSYSGIIGIVNAILEHPAVSSVGFDVIFCWITWFLWWRLQRQGVEGPIVLEKEEYESWDGVGSATTAAGGLDGGAVRRR